MRRAVLVGFFFLLGQGCSLAGLGDFDVPACEPAACDRLNEAYGITDPCVRFHCAADGVCRLQPIDRDGDGHADARCAGREGCGSILPCDDCDDTAAAAFPGAQEVCDGLDNDCNLIVDDVTNGAASSVAVVTGTDRVDWHAYAQPLDGEAVAPVAFGARTAFFNVIERDEPAAQALGVRTGNLDQLVGVDTQMGCPSDHITVPTGPSAAVNSHDPPTEQSCTSHADCDDGILCNGFELCNADAPSADERGCTSGADNEPACRPGAQCNEDFGICEFENLGVASGCNFADLDVAPFGHGQWFGAMAERTACGNVLRVGYFTEGAMDAAMAIPGRNLLFRGDVRRSTSFRGIDRVYTDSGHCTGRSRDAEDAFGARLPSIAALTPDVRAGRRRPQALVAWLVPNEASQPVEVIGIWQEEFGNPRLKWVNATGDGIPQRLETEAVGDVRPVLLSVGTESGAGYLLAYGASDGGIALRFIPPFADPDGVVLVEPYTTPISADSGQRRSEPIQDLGAEHRLTTAGIAKGVSLALGRQAGDLVELGLTWRDDDGIHFQRVELDATTGAFDDSSAPHRLSDDEPDELVIGHTPEAIVLPGFERNGLTADEETGGGYLVAWRAGGTTHGARIADLDGQPLGEPITLGTGLGRLHIYSARTSNDIGSERRIPRLIHHDPDTQEFRAQPFCGPGS